MAKLYVFGIGGTGSRVIKALTMLLAAGVKLENGFDTVVPIIVDPDTANGDLNRTADILTKYQNIYSKIGTNNNFFGTKVSTLRQLTDGNVTNLNDNFKFNVDGSGQKFGESIDYNGLDDENKALIDLLFSKANLDADMTVGFKGNPNIGSIVLNKMVDSKEYSEFTNSFNKGDAVFIISSIFGGTGAAGFPLLLKNLRNKSAKIANSEIISSSKIGAITYLPYFKISEPSTGEKTIDSSTFHSKAKAALSYYEHAIFKAKTLDAFYYLGDNSDKNMPYAEGNAEQKNDAHFLEMAGALAIVNFISDINNHSHASMEFGIESSNKKKLNFNSLGTETKNIISLPLSKLWLLYNFYNKSKSQLSNSKGSFNKEAVLEEFYNKDFYKVHFSKFMNYYNEWITEMDQNDVSFSPFHENQTHDTLLDYIVEKLPKSTFLSNKVSGDIVIREADKIAKGFNNETAESRFIKIFDKILEDQVNNILN